MHFPLSSHNTLADTHTHTHTKQEQSFYGGYQHKISLTFVVIVILCRVKYMEQNILYRQTQWARTYIFAPAYIIYIFGRSGLYIKVNIITWGTPIAYIHSEIVLLSKLYYRYYVMEDIIK